MQYLYRSCLIAAVATVATVAYADAATLDLAACTQRALARNHEVQMAAQVLARNKAQVRASRSALLPHASATLLGYSRLQTGEALRRQDNPTGLIDPATGERLFQEEPTRIPGVGRDLYRFDASVRQLAFDGGRARNALRASARRRAAAAQALGARRSAVAVEVVRRYCQLLQMAELYDLQRAALARGAARLAEARDRRLAGANTRSDVLRLEVSLANARRRLGDAGHDRALARTRLAYLVGVDPDSAFAVAPLATSRADGLGPLSQLLDRALAHNGDLRRLALERDAARLQLASARRAWWPRLNGSLSYSRSNEAFDRVYGDLERNWRLETGLTLSYGLFEGDARRAAVAAARAEFRLAELALQRQEEEVELAVRAGHLRLRNLIEGIALAGATAALARQDLQLVEERYRLGRGRLLEVLDAQAGLLAAERDGVQLRYTAEVVAAELALLAGQVAAENEPNVK